MRWFRVCRVDELKPGQGRSITLFARPYAVFNVDGQLYGLDGACGHMKADLSVGVLIDGVVECRMHGWRYDVTSGECITGGGAELRTYPVKVEENQIWIGVEWPPSGHE